MPLTSDRVSWPSHWLLAALAAGGWALGAYGFWLHELDLAAGGHAAHPDVLAAMYKTGNKNGRFRTPVAMASEISPALTALAQEIRARTDDIRVFFNAAKKLETRGEAAFFPHGVFFHSPNGAFHS